MTKPVIKNIIIYGVIALICAGTTTWAITRARHIWQMMQVAEAYNITTGEASFMAKSKAEGKTPTKTLQYTSNEEIPPDATIVFFKVGCPYCEAQYKAVTHRRNQLIEEDPNMKQKIKFLNIESELGESFVRQYGISHASTIFKMADQSSHTVTSYDAQSKQYPVDIAQLHQLLQ